MEIRKIAALIHGVVEGSNDVDIMRVSGVDSAKKGDITFALDEEHLSQAEKSQASCVLTDEKIRKSSKTLIRVKNPKLSFLLLYNIFSKPDIRQHYRHPTSSVAVSVRLGENVWIGPFVSIDEDVVIGNNCIIESYSVIMKGSAIGNNCHLYPGVTVYGNCTLKNNIIIHAGAVIGADGFGYVKESGKIYKFPQLGRVIIEDDVEIGANTTVDRGSLSDTLVGAGSKIDNLCQAAHNVKIGKNVLIAAQTGISGSTVIKDNVTMGGQVGIADNLVVGENVMVGAKSGVIGDIDSNTIVWGIPARPIAQVKRQMAVLSWMTKNFKQISKIFKSKDI